MSRPWVVGLALAACGCASSPTPRFYSLSALKAPSSAAPGGAAAAVLAVGPVAVPDSVDRPEIVTTVGPNELAVHDFDRWAGDLGKDLERALIEALSAALPAGRFEVVPWDPAASALVAARRLTVTVTRFELSAGREAGALLEAEWTLAGPRGQVLATRKSSRKAAADGAGIKDAVAAMSRCARELGAEIAADLRSF